MTDYVMGKDTRSLPNGSLPFSDSGKYVTLGVAGSASIAVPAGMTIAVFAYTPGETVLVSTAAISYVSSATFATGLFDINPEVRRVVGGTDTLYFYSVGASIIKVSFYRR